MAQRVSAWSLIVVASLLASCDQGSPFQSDGGWWTDAAIEVTRAPIYFDGVLPPNFDASQCPAGTNVIVGTAGNNTLNGTAGNDCIFGLGGDDAINGFGGDDIIIGGAGNDGLVGGDGDDLISGDAGNDSVGGGAGNDVLHGGAGNDTLRGNTGNDVLYAGDGNDVLWGDELNDPPGNNTLYGGAGNDNVMGGAGDDYLDGGDGNDQVSGWLGNDALIGGPGNDQLLGQGGNDILQGGTGNDQLLGQDGNDTLLDGVGSNSIDGGPGSDRCVGTGCESAAPAACSAPSQCGSNRLCESGLCIYCRSAADCDDGNSSTSDTCAPTTACVHTCMFTPTAEVCDGLDNDCDGIIDDGLTRSRSCGQGACVAVGQERCVDGATVLACTPGSPTGSDTTCDRSDDDCDGLTDEGFVPTATECVDDRGQPLITFCYQGEEVNPCKPEGSSCGACDRFLRYDITCDGCDDDCDGEVDENCDQCGDGVDNDGNGIVDCYCPPSRCGERDARCDGALTCPSQPAPAQCGLRPDYELGDGSVGFLGSVQLNTQGRADVVGSELCNPPSSAPAPGVTLRWFPPEVDPGQSARFVIDTAGSAINTLVDVYFGCISPTGPLTTVACNDDALGSRAARVEIDLHALPFRRDYAPGFLIVVQSADGSEGPVSLSIRRQPQPEYCPPLEVLLDTGPAGTYEPIDEDLNGLADCEEPACADICRSLSEAGLCTNGVDDDDQRDNRPGADCADQDCRTHPLCCGSPDCAPKYCDAPFRLPAPSGGRVIVPLTTAYGPLVDAKTACAPQESEAVAVPMSFTSLFAQPVAYRFRLQDPSTGIVSIARECNGREDACVGPTARGLDNAFARSGAGFVAGQGAIERTVATGENLLVTVWGPPSAAGYHSLIVERVERGARCDNRMDDDADHLVDCADPDCQTSGCGETLCHNGIDDDDDGHLDCVDSDCRRAVECNSGQCAEQVIGPDPAPGSWSATGTLESGGIKVISECGARPLGPEVAFEWVPPSPGTYLIDTRGSEVDTVVMVGECSGRGQVCDDDSGGQGASEIVYEVAPVQTPVPLLIHVHGFNAAAGDFRVNVRRPAPAVELCDDARDNDNDARVDCGDTDCAGEPVCVLSIEVCGGGFDEDADGDVDCGDADCAADVRCSDDFEACPGPDTSYPGNEFSCADPNCATIDSDRDRTTDCGGDLCPFNPDLLAPVAHYADLDRDGFGDPRAPYMQGDRPAEICGLQGWVSVVGDCRDTDPEVSHTGTDNTCDRQNDDCDLATDEGYVPRSSACGLGVCLNNGITSCVSGNVQSNCVPLAPTGDDSDCDALDDDCNGTIDESYPMAATRCGVGACARQGIESCVAGAVVNTCVAGTPASEDRTCDAIDNDCNGLTDDGYEGSETRCGVGACASVGVAVCVNGIEGSTCVEGTPLAETCDGVDNDCDNATDESLLVDCYDDPDHDGYSGASQVSARACSCGEAFTSRAPGLGTIDCDPSNGSVYPGAAEVCDGLDQDCDAAVDEGVLIACYVDADRDSYAGSAGANVLACTCSDGFTALRPEPGTSQDCDDFNPASAPGASEVCDRADNDCDGAIDEEAGCVDDSEPYIGAPCVTDDDCASEEMPTAFCYREAEFGIVGGLCLAWCDTSACPDNSWCLSEVGENADQALCVPSCDANGGCLRDNAQCTLAGANDRVVTYCIPFCTTHADCGEGRFCNEGFCYDYEPSCDSSEDADCDGYDQDCDGSTDEGYRALTECVSSDCGGIGDLSCEGGVISSTCTQDTPECVATPTATTRCQRDADCASLGNDWTCLEESEGFRGGRCVQYCNDTTVCSVGTQCFQGTCMPTCSSDDECLGPDEHCLVNEGSALGFCVAFCTDDSQCVRGCNDDTHLCDCQRETCDGTDNDCDGAIDEGDSEWCDNTDNDCDGAVDEGMWCCNSETCDGSDNDCDGVVDEGLTCGCMPMDDDCDGVDDDCDGVIDDDFAAVIDCDPCGVTVPLVCAGGVVVGSCPGDVCGEPNCDATIDDDCDGVDDDCDGVIDDDFAEVIDCNPCGVTVPLVCADGVVVGSCPSGACSEDCGNGIDDNDNGRVDCDDSACTHEPTCVANSPVGTQCATNADCPLYNYVLPVIGPYSFQMCQTALEGVGGGTNPIGYCLAICSPDLGIACPGGSVCADGLCLRACDDNGECGDPALACEAYPTQSGGSVDACVPHCDSDADCPGGKSCVQLADNTPGTLSAGVCRDCASNDATCDAHDDDCDNLIDEDWGDNGSGYEEYSCGVGVCERFGERICTYDGVVDFGCTPGNPIPTAFDVESGMDEDCDGLVDEDSCNLIGCDPCFECNSVTGLCEDHGACQPCGGACDADELCNESEGTCVPTYATVYREVFAPKCNNATCHGAEPFAGNLPLTETRSSAINRIADDDVACAGMTKGECTLTLVRAATMPDSAGCTPYAGTGPYPQENNDDPACLNEAQYLLLEAWVTNFRP